MPLRLVPPRPGKTPNYYVRGTYYGVRVDTTTGTPDRAKARQALNRIKADIERGAYAPKTGLTFAAAALSYLQAGGEDRFMTPLADHFANTLLADIDQVAIDAAAAKLYPTASSATRNRQVYTPVSAILKRVGMDLKLRRPKGAQGQVKTGWLWPDEAFKVLDGAEALDLEFRIFLATLLYTGMRLSEVLAIKAGWVRLDEAFIFIPKTKNSEPRAIHLPPHLVAELANHPRGLARGDERLFRFRKSGRLYTVRNKISKATGVAFDFHMFRHTWATWMRRYAGLDIKALIETKAWKDPKSAARYAHVVLEEEATRADLLPTPKKRNGR